MLERHFAEDYQQTFGNVASYLWEAGVRNGSFEAVTIEVSLRLWKWLKLQWDFKAQAKNRIVDSYLPEVGETGNRRGQEGAVL